MSPIETYLYLFFDTVLAALIVPLKTSAAFPAMLVFGGYSFALIIVIAALGGILGACGNWGIGRLLKIASLIDQRGEDVGALKKISRFLQGRGRYLLLFAAIPGVGALITIFAGFALVPLRKTWFLFLGSFLAYYTVLAALTAVQ